MNPTDLSLKLSRSRTIIFVVLLPDFSSFANHETNVTKKFSLIERTIFLSSGQKNNCLLVSNGKRKHVQGLCFCNLL